MKIVRGCFITSFDRQSVFREGLPRAPEMMIVKVPEWQGHCFVDAHSHCRHTALDFYFA